MSFDQHRWRCGCGANNMLQSGHCFHCGAARPAPSPPPRYLAPNTPPPGSPFADPLQGRHVAQPAPARTRAFPWVALGLAVGCGVPLAGFMAFCLCFGISAATQAPATNSGTASEPDAFRVHQADLRGTSPQGGGQLGRCTICAGSGKTWRWGHTGDGKDPNQYFREGAIPCPFCDGTGTENFSQKGVHSRVVGDDQATDYTPELAAAPIPGPAASRSSSRAVSTGSEWRGPSSAEYHQPPLLDAPQRLPGGALLMHPDPNRDPEAQALIESVEASSPNPRMPCGDKALQFKRAPDGTILKYGCLRGHWFEHDDSGWRPVQP